MWWAAVKGHWVIGTYSNIDNNKIGNGVITNFEDTSCPSDSQHWYESSTSWAVNVKAHVSCNVRIKGKC